MTPAVKIGGPERAALVLLALDEEVAAQVMRHLDEDDIKRLAACADRLEPIPTDAIAPAFEEFERCCRQPMLPRGAGAYLRKLTATTLGDERAEKLFGPPAPPTHAIEKIRAARSNTLAELLSEEHPQVAAVILSQLKREQAASVLLAVPQDRQVDLLRRMAQITEVPEQLVALASEGMARALASAGGIGPAGGVPDFNGVSFAAGLLNELPPTDSERLLTSLEEAEAALVPKIREAMFTFEDLGRLGVRALQVLMREVSTEQLLIALKTASEEMREHFMSAVSSRAATAMREDLAAMPPTRLSDVEGAQREIVEAAMRLASDGRVTLPGRSGEKMV